MLIIQQTKKSKVSRNDSQIELQSKNDKGEGESINPDKKTNQQQFIYPIEDNASQQDEISKYKIDLKKKRRIYEFDRTKPFVYSNQLDT